MDEDQVKQPFKIGVELDHHKCVAILAAAGYDWPRIPAGFNTIEMLFRTKEGFYALCSNQTGFKMTIADNENPVNGCTVIQIMHPEICPEEAAEVMKQAMLTLCPPDGTSHPWADPTIFDELDWQPYRGKE